MSVSILHFSVSHSIERLQAFYYLDQIPPQIKNLSPDIRRSQTVASETRFFQLEASDSGSGVDWEKSSIHIKRDRGGKMDFIEGRRELGGGRLIFEADSELEPGNYLWEASLLDRAGRETYFVDSFAVEPQNLGIEISREPLEQSPERERFAILLKSLTTPARDLMVYRIRLFHQAPPEMVFRNVKIQAELPGPIIAFHEIGSSRTDRKDPFPAVQSGIWNKKIFPERKWIEIGEMDSHGMIVFMALVKCGEGAPPKKTSMLFSGSYEYQSYQHSGVKNISLWVPTIKKEKA